MKRLAVRTALIIISLVILMTGCMKEEKSGFNLAVVVPGVAAGSPLYEGLVAGSERAVGDRDGVSMKVVELGYNQAEWQEKITGVVATGLYDLVVTSNPALPYLCVEVAKAFPDQKFLIVDAYFDGHSQMATILYNQVEQSYLLGHMAGLLSQEAGTEKIGMIVAQEYPALTKMIIPGFLAGAQAVNPNIELDQRLLGNWYDANKAAELTKSMVDGGAVVIGSICGGASQGVIDAAGEAGAKVMMWDSNEYGRAPGIVAGSGALAQERLVFEEVTKAIEGSLDFGTARVVSLADGYVEFVTDDENYRNTVPTSLQEAQAAVISSIKNGTLRLEVPEL